MRGFCTRYYNDTGKRNYDIVLYTSRREAEDSPHDWLLSFTKSQWKKMGLRLPKERQIWEVELKARLRCIHEDRGSVY